MFNLGYNGSLKRFIAYSLVVAGIFVSRVFVYAEHDKSCKNVHGKVTVIAEDASRWAINCTKWARVHGVSKGDAVVKLEDFRGDIGLPGRGGKDDIAAVKWLRSPCSASMTRCQWSETEYVRETERWARFARLELQSHPWQGDAH